MANIDPWSQTIEAQQPSAKPEWLTEEIEAQLTAHKYPISKDGLLMLHQHTKSMFDNYKEKEMILRKIVAKVFIPDAKEGINTVSLGNNFDLKVNNKFNYKLDNDNDNIWTGLEKIEKLGNEGKFVAERLVSWQPNFLLKEYRQLQDDANKGSEFAKSVLKEIEKFMTIIPAAPEIEIKEPKKKGKK